MHEELPFLARERPWAHADVVVVNDERAGGVDDPVRSTRWTASSSTTSSVPPPQTEI